MMPKDPVMLLSYVNTQLRDFYPSLAEFCAAMQTEESDLREKLALIDYEYDETGLLTKETIRDPETSEVLRYSEYRNENGLNMEIMVYTSLPTEKKPIELRRITKSYDQNGNLHQLVSEELASSSSQSSFSESYEYI
jgi:hypothetical protein